MRHLKLAAALCLAFASVPAVSAQPPEDAPAPASASRIDTLFEVIDMPTMMGQMMQQMFASQQAMQQSFDKDLGEAERQKLQATMERANAIMAKYLAWDRLEPIMRDVYSQVFTAREVDAMIAFYRSPEGAATLKKSPQAMALAMQAMQPLMAQALAELEQLSEMETKATTK